MPSKTTVPIPLSRWFKDVKKIEELRTLLDVEVMQEAMATLKEVAGPSYNTLNETSTVNSHRHAWYAGYRDAFNDLHKLTHAKQTSGQQHQEEWNHIQPPPQ